MIHASNSTGYLLLHCREAGVPLPAGEVILVPESWAGHKCPHLEGGFELEFLPCGGVEDCVVSGQWNDDEEVEAPEVNLDATKNIGYPVRELGRYGSHPSHDGFGDESDP